MILLRDKEQELFDYYKKLGSYKTALSHCVVDLHNSKKKVNVLIKELNTLISYMAENGLPFPTFLQPLQDGSELVTRGYIDTLADTLKRVNINVDPYVFRALKGNHSQITVKEKE